MTAEQIRADLENVDQSLRSTVEILVSMGSKLPECAPVLESVARRLKAIIPHSRLCSEQPIRLLFSRISGHASSIQQLFESAASFHMGRISAEPREAITYLPSGHLDQPAGAPRTLQLQA